MKLVSIIIIVVLTIILIMMLKKTKESEAHWNKHQDHIVPRFYPVYLDAQTPYLNEQILYGEWDQEISSSL